MKPLKRVKNTALVAASLFLISYSILGYSATDVSADYTAIIKINNQSGNKLNFEPRDRQNFKRPALCTSILPGKSCTITLKFSNHSNNWENTVYKYRFKLVNDDNKNQSNVYHLQGCNVGWSDSRRHVSCGFTIFKPDCTLQGNPKRVYGQVVPLEFSRAQRPYYFSDSIVKKCSIKTNTVSYRLTIR